MRAGAIMLTVPFPKMRSHSIRPSVYPGCICPTIGKSDGPPRLTASTCHASSWNSPSVGRFSRTMNANSPSSAAMSASGSHTRAVDLYRCGTPGVVVGTAVDATSRVWSAAATRFQRGRSRPRPRRCARTPLDRPRTVVRA